jgi:hypothetical protein
MRRAFLALTILALCSVPTSAHSYGHGHSYGHFYAPAVFVSPYQTQFVVPFVQTQQVYIQPQQIYVQPQAIYTPPAPVVAPVAAPVTAPVAAPRTPCTSATSAPCPRPFAPRCSAAFRLPFARPLSARLPCTAGNPADLPDGVTHAHPTPTTT